MSSKIKVWIETMRLRTLPLSISGIIVGNSVAYSYNNFSWTIFILSLATTISFQVLSNLANDYGDGVKGTDNKNRIGPPRALQQGLLNEAELKKGIWINIIISLLLTLVLIGISFKNTNLWFTIIFILLGIMSIIGAVKYTIGGSAYGYYALGDLFVLVFFGGVSVLGSHFLQTKTMDALLILPAISIGLLSVGVLNTNNMRDRKTDMEAKKITLAVLLGLRLAKIYHSVLLFVALILTVIYMKISENSSYLFIIITIPLAIHLYRVLNNNNPKDLDSELKYLALNTFIFAILFSMSIIL